jgi:pSer/pThr/pTyr-binding forkhead associated (FHA) protein
MTDTPESADLNVAEDLDLAGSFDETPNQTASLALKRNGSETGDVFPVTPPCTIGRFDPETGPIDVDLGSLPEGAYVSRKHAKITCQDGVWRLHDLASSNGTFVLRDDFERVEESEIADGTEFALGNARFIFRLGEQA